MPFDKATVTFRTVNFKPNYIKQISEIAEKHDRLDLWGINIEFIDDKIQVEIEWTDNGMYDLPHERGSWELRFICDNMQVSRD